MSHPQQSSRWREISLNALWKQNPGLVQLLGLCPVLAVSNTLINALALGLATTLVTTLSGAIIASLRHLIPHHIRNPIFILLIATLVSCVDLAMNAWLHGLYLVLGIFIPLITTNCIVIGRAEAFAARNSTAESALDGLTMGLGLTLVLVALGGLREIVGKGTLFDGAHLLVGDLGHHLVIHIIPADAHYQFLLAMLPPGGFIGLALLIAGKNWLDQRTRARQQALASNTPLPDTMAP